MVDGEAGEAGEAGGYSWENPEHSSAENDDTSGKIYQRLNLVAGSLSFYLEFFNIWGSGFRGCSGGGSDEREEVSLLEDPASKGADKDESFAARFNRR